MKVTFWRLLLGYLAVTALASAIAWLVVQGRYAMHIPPVLPDDAHAAAMASLRGVLDGQAPAKPSHPALAMKLPKNGPAIVSVWVRGRRMIRVEGRGATAADAFEDAAKNLAVAPAMAALTTEDRRTARIQVDLVVARGRFDQEAGAKRAMGLLPGMDGLGVELPALGREVLLGSDELVHQSLLLSKKPIKFVEFSVGLDFSRADIMLAVRAALGPGGYGAQKRSYFRFRADSFVERPVDRRGEGAPLALVRGLPAGPKATKANMMAAATLGARYLARHLTANGRFVYELDLATGHSSNPNDFNDYSLPRHAGTAYFLNQMYGETHDEEFKVAAERAMETVAQLAREGNCSGTDDHGQRWACVTDRGAAQANMGSTALTVIAMSEYKRVTGDPRYDETNRALVNWILDMQKPDGSFVHLYSIPDHKKDLVSHLLYFDGEAVLALVKAHQVFLDDDRLVKAAERGLDYQVKWYDFFAGQFFFGEEHWTCISAEQAWPYLKNDRYREFCADYAAFLRDGQFQPGEHPGQPDLPGAYGVTPFFMPHNTPTGSRTEAMISAYLLTKHHGKPDDRIRKQDLAGISYLLRQQVRDENDWWIPVGDADGALSSSAIDKNVRIDFVQHACSAILRARELADE